MPGHWEGDLIIGLDRSAIGTVVERSTRFTMLVHLPRMPGYGTGPRVKNGPALAGYGAEAMRDALASRFTSMPEQLRRSLTWDRGKELAQHAQLTIATGLAVYFADPHSPWQRGTNENTNGLLRQYFPKGTDLSRWSRDEIEAIAAAVDAQRAAHQGWPGASSRVFERLDRAHEHGAWVALDLGNRVEAVVHTIDQVHVGHARLAIHQCSAPARSAASVRRGVVGPDVRFGFDDPARAADAVVRRVDEDLAEHLPRDEQRWARVKGAREAAQRPRPASWASRIASATSRIDLREFMLRR